MAARDGTDQAWQRHLVSRLGFGLNDLRGRRVLVRTDLNVPSGLPEDVSGFRIRAAMPTVRRLRSVGARVVLCTHLGTGLGVGQWPSVRPIAARVSGELGVPVGLSTDVVGRSARDAVAALEPGSVVLLANVRGEPGETDTDPDVRAAFAQRLAGLADVVVNDAFATTHRRHASMVELARFAPAAPGLLMMDEVDQLSRVHRHPVRPLVAVMGGAKVADKLRCLAGLAPAADKVLVGGVLALALLEASGVAVRRHGRFTTAEVDLAGRLLRDHPGTIEVPRDVVTADARISRIRPGQPPLDGRDIGPATVGRYAAMLSGAGTVFWNGPMGVYEDPAFLTGTALIAKAAADAAGVTVVGGGDTVTAVSMVGLLDSFEHVSTGGGAMLALLSGDTPPALAGLGLGH